MAESDQQLEIEIAPDAEFACFDPSSIEQVLFHTGWNRKQAAKLLGVSYKTLLLKIRESGLEPS